jgi:DNA-binding beta-propeller fold protein YncE
MRVYVTDTKTKEDAGQVHIIDLPSGKRLGSIDTLYDPDVAVAPDGSRLFVAQTDLRKSPDEDRDQVVAYDTKTLKPVFTVNLRNRSLYNVAPTSSNLVVSSDGRSLFVAKTETLGDDQARHSIAVLDTKSGKFRKEEVELRYTPLNIGTLGQSPRLHLALSGRSGEAIGFADIKKTNGTAQLMQFSDEKEETLVSLIASGADPSGRLIYAIAKPGMLRVLDFERKMLSEPISLTIPRAMAIPLQHFLISKSQLFIGMGREELSARGQSEDVYVYDVDGSLIFRSHSIGLSPPCEKIYLSPDGKQLIGLSREFRSVQVRDVASARVVAVVEDIGESPVSMALPSQASKPARKGASVRRAAKKPARSTSRK